MGGLGHDEPKALISDISGIYFAGSYRGTVDFDPGIGVVNKTSNGDFDIFVQKLTHNGDYLWVNTYGGPGNDAAYELCFGFSNIFMCQDILKILLISIQVLSSILSHQMVY